MMLIKLKHITTSTGVMLSLLLSITALGQTATEINAKYPAVNAYEVRPGILMTVKYADNGEVCEITLQRYYSPNQPDADTTIPAKLEDQLIDELAPQALRGPANNQPHWNGFTAGGVSHFERDFANVLVTIDGTYWCSEESGGKTNCGHGGTKVITIQWKKRTCATPKSSPLASKKPRRYAASPH